MSLIRPTLVGLACCVASLLAAAPAQAFNLAGLPWPGGRVPYFNAAKADAPSVRAAVRLWNNSGARVKFVAVPRSKAQVVIYTNKRGCVGYGYATVGHTTRGYVYLPLLTPDSAMCNRQVVDYITTHELGHVLGLDHERDRCALMNPSTSYQGPVKCPEPADQWQYRCRVLQADDVKGAIRRYGGRMARLRTPALCDFYTGGGAPEATQISRPDPAGAAQITILRPVDPLVPTFVRAILGESQPAFSVVAQLNTCATSPDEGVNVQTSAIWSSNDPGAPTTVDLVVPQTPGHYCFTTFALDAVGRPSSPTSSFFDVVAPTP